MPGFEDYPYEDVIRTVVSYCQQEEIACVNLLPERAKHRAEALWVHTLDSSPKSRDRFDPIETA